jgi:hypothetical protein
MSTSNIVCVCPYCKTKYEWVNYNCCLLEEEQEREREIEQDIEIWREQEQQQEQQQQQEDDDDLVTCGNCGNRWDGYAQCNCWGYMMYDNYENNNYENDTHNQLNLAEATTVRQQH